MDSAFSTGDIILKSFVIHAKYVVYHGIAANFQECSFHPELSLKKNAYINTPSVPVALHCMSTMENRN